VSPLIAAILGVVEGLTEFLPVSSTGHLIVADALLYGKDEPDASKAFEIVIQLGAILAVAVHYRALIAERLAGLAKRDPKAVQLAQGLVIAFVPVAIVGLKFGKKIKHYLFNPTSVAVALIAGGVIMVAFEGLRRGKQGAVGLEHVTLKRAGLIGLAQCVSLIPGSSRAMCTILTGELTGLSTATAAEFSFLLSLPTLGAATIYEAIKSRHELATGIGTSSILVGMIVSFLVAWAVITAFLRYLQRRGLGVFGVYRVIVGLVILWVFRG
jgi:undecaprenyl-diphosphatase